MASVRARVRCVGCRQNVAQRAGGLCKSCFRDPLLRRLHPRVRCRPAGEVCRNCKARPVHVENKRLCWRCRADPVVRGLYPPPGKVARQGAGPLDYARSRPCVPHPHPPWSDAALAEMSARVTRGEAVKHRRDGYEVDLS